MKFYEVFLTIYASLHILGIVAYIVWTIIAKMKQRKNRLRQLTNAINDLSDRIDSLEDEFNEYKNNQLQK